MRRPPRFVSVPAVALSAALVLLGPGCFARVQMGPSQIESLDCETGAFVATVPVQRRGGKAKIVYEFLPGEENVTALDRDPKRQALRRRDKAATVSVSGKLVDRCADGGVTMLASFPPGGATGFVDVDAVLPASSPDTARATEPSGEFSYAVTFQCCGPEAASTYTVTGEPMEGMTAIEVEPSSFSCQDEETIEVEVRGKLAQPGTSGRARIVLLDREAQLQCSVHDEIEPP